MLVELGVSFGELLVGFCSVLGSLFVGVEPVFSVSFLFDDFPILTSKELFQSLI